MAEPGLRERKKAATRLAISRAALKLAIEGGLNSLTGDAIADAANVAPRTFRNYFPSKEDALLYILVEFERSIVEAFQDQDNTAPVLDSLEAALVAVIESSAAELDDWLAVTRIVVLHPTLRAHYAANYNVNSSDLLDEIARRTETNPAVDMYPRVVSLSAF
jgi:AcrR family transcriptional regulator